MLLYICSLNKLKEYSVVAKGVGSSPNVALYISIRQMPRFKYMSFECLMRCKFPVWKQLNTLGPGRERKTYLWLCTFDCSQNSMVSFSLSVEYEIYCL